MSRRARGDAHEGSGVAALVNLTHRLRRRRRAERTRTLRSVLVVSAATAAFVGCGWVAINSALVEVREVTVEGTSRLSPEQVLAVADVRRGQSLFRLDPAAIAHRVETLAPVAAARVSRDWPHRVVISVVERRPVAAVTEGSTATLLDRTGVAFATVPKAPDGLVPVTLGAPLNPSRRDGPGAADARAAMRVLDDVPASLRARIEGLHAPSPVEVSFDLRGGRTVVWGSAEDGSRKAAVLRSLLLRHATVYDVSTPDVVVTH
jgi:cell division protein FtsQ